MPTLRRGRDRNFTRSLYGNQLRRPEGPARLQRHDDDSARNRYQDAPSREPAGCPDCELDIMTSTPLILFPSDPQDAFYGSLRAAIG